MKPAQYAVVRYIGDPARNEALNIGVVAWDDTTYRLRVDPEAAQRVVRENPHLSEQALLSVEPLLHDELQRTLAAPGGSVPQYLERQRGYPVLLTDPLFVAVREDTPTSVALDDAVDQLVARLVHPRRRTYSRATPAMQRFVTYFRPLLAQHLMERNYSFPTSGTGTQRRVDFYANSGVNLALDTLQLNFREIDRIIEAADHEAFKIGDITHSNQQAEFVVYCALPSDELLAGATQNAMRIIRSTGAEVMTDVDQTARFVVDKVQAH